jgi:uncharacterized integral membrane protein
VQVSNEPINKAKNTWKHAKLVGITFLVAMIIFIIVQNWEDRQVEFFNMEPVLPLSIWFALFFILGVAVGWYLAIKRRR